MIDLIKPGQPDPEYTLNKLGEKGRCLLSGSEENLVTFPVDNDLQNLLPTNIACLSKDQLKATDLMVYGYVLETDRFKVYFETFDSLKEHNEKVVKSIPGFVTTGSKIGDIKFLFEELAKRHAKGIFKIELDNCSLNCMQLQHWLLTQIQQQNKGPSIIQ